MGHSSAHNRNAAARAIAGLFLWSAAAGSGLAAEAPSFLRGIGEASVRTPRAERSLLIDVKIVDDLALAVGEFGHVLASRDAGETWVQGDVPVRALLTAVARTSGGAWLAVGHDALILRSEDAGATWEIRHRDIEIEKPFFNVWCGPNGQALAIGAYGLCLSSKDDGRTWTEQIVDEDESHLFGISEAPDGSIYVAGEFGVIFRYDEEEETWEPLDSPYEGTLFGVLALDSGTLLVYGLRGNLFRSEDEGESWEKVATDTNTGLFHGLQAPDGRVILVGQGGAVLVSNDDGRTFQDRGPDTRELMSAAAFLPDGRLLVVGENGARRISIREGARKP